MYCILFITKSSESELLCEKYLFVYLHPVLQYLLAGVFLQVRKLVVNYHSDFFFFFFFVFKVCSPLTGDILLFHLNKKEKNNGSY